MIICRQGFHEDDVSAYDRVAARAMPVNGANQPLPLMQGKHHQLGIHLVHRTSPELAVIVLTAVWPSSTVRGLLRFTLATPRKLDVGHQMLGCVDSGRFDFTILR